MNKIHNPIGRPPSNPQLAAVLHTLNFGESVYVAGSNIEDTKRLANSLSRTAKRYNNARLSVRALKNGKVKISCVSTKKPTFIKLG
jgi:hypothetical protein